MSNLEKYGSMSLKSGLKADELVKLLIKQGFLVCEVSNTFNEIQYEIFKEK